MKKLSLLFLITAFILFPSFNVLSAQTNTAPAGCNLSQVSDKNFICPPGCTVKQCQEWTLKQIGTKTGYGSAVEVSDQEVAQKIGSIISIVLAFLGVIFLFFIVYSGMQWMTAGGNDERITKARKRMINAVIGLAIVVSAYILTDFVVKRLQENSLTGQQNQQSGDDEITPCSNTGGQCVTSCTSPDFPMNGYCPNPQICCFISPI